MVLSNELSHLLVLEPLYVIQLITCWNLLPQKGDRKKNLIFISSVFAALLIIYNYILFKYGFTSAANSVFFLLTIPGFILYFIISKYHDGRLFFSYFFSDSILSIFNFIIYAILINFFKELTIPFIILRNILMFFFSTIFNLYYIKKIRVALETKSVNWNVIASISVFAGIYIYYELIVKGSIIDRFDELFSISLTFILLAIVFLTLLWTIVKIKEKETQEIELLKKENSLDLIRIQLKQVDSTYSQINETYNKLRYIKHDVNKQLMILERLCYVGDIKKIKDHIGTMLNSIPESKFIMFSNNQFLNSILNHYNQLIEKEQIIFDYSIKIKTINEKITPDICIILANALENAIEACTKSNEKIIELNIIEKNNSLFISIRNTFNPKLIKLVDDKIQTSKKDIDNHGLGLKIIDNIAISHGGNSLYIIEDNVFRLDIWINIS